MRDAGGNLIETLESYLPREQSKLNIIGCKVLDIFYDEFIKFVPAYILKREEEKRQENPPVLDVSPSMHNLNPPSQFKNKKLLKKLAAKSNTG